MAWLAFEHLRASAFAGVRDPAIVGLDRDVAAALLCGLAAAGLLVTRTRSMVALSIVLATGYLLSGRYVAGTLDYDALTYGPVVVAALAICWPRLIRMKQT